MIDDLNKLIEATSETIDGAQDRASTFKVLIEDIEEQSDYQKKRFTEYKAERAQKAKAVETKSHGDLVKDFISYSPWEAVGEDLEF